MREGTAWSDAGTLNLMMMGGDAAAARANQALLDGRLQVQPSRWGRVSLDGGPQQSVNESARKEPHP